MSIQTPFSMRHRYAEAKEIAIREDAPEGLRVAVIGIPNRLGWRPSDLRSTLCLVLRKKPDSSNWSEHPNIWGEVNHLINECPWFKVYDIIEALYASMASLDTQRGEDKAAQYEKQLNNIFLEDGIGWKLVNGQIVMRGNESFEAVVMNAEAQLAASGRPTAANHINKALECLSHRPEPNASGAAYHAMGSLECVARDISGDPKATLGEILKRYPDLLPAPLDKALSQIWGYASNEARHVQEGREIRPHEAELLVSLSATISTYLARAAKP